MEYRWLVSFSTLANYLNFSHAATALYITQPALSKQIAALEEEIGTPLFSRDKRNVSLTIAGKAFLPEVQKLLQRTGEAIDVAKNAHLTTQDDRGKLVIAFDSMLPYSFLSENSLSHRISVFQRNNPSITLTFRSIPLRHIEEGVRAQTIDLAISLIPRIKSERLPNYSHHTLRTDHWALLVPAQYGHLEADGSCSLEALGGLPFLSRSDNPNYLSERLTLLIKLGLSPSLLYCRDWDEIFMRTDMGEGFCLVPIRCAQAMRTPQTGIIPLVSAGDMATVDTVISWDSKNMNPAIPLFLSHEV